MQIGSDNNISIIDRKYNVPELEACPIETTIKILERNGQF